MAAFIFLLLTAALTGAAPAALAKSDIVIGIQQEPTVLDPTADATASIDGMMMHTVFESLTTVDEQGQVKPDLATRWTISDDGLTYTFTLVQGVTFHDGSAFDADDVKFSFDRAMAPNSVSPSKGIFKDIEQVQVLNPSTVVIKLKHKDAFFLFNMAQGDASIVAPESADHNKTHPIGTGPFMFKSWTRGDRVVLVKNERFRSAPEVAMEKVTFRFIADPMAATAALLAADVDAFPNFPAPELIKRLEADPRFKVTVGSTQGEVILAMNNARYPFTDLRVRQAISHALNRKEIIDGAMYGLAPPIGSFFPPSDKAYIDLTGTYPYNVAKAKALLHEAGVADGTTLTLRIPPFSYATRTATIVQAELAKVNLNVKIEPLEWGAWLAQVYKKANYDMTIISHASPNDMGNFAKGKGYYYGYDSPEFTILWDHIEHETDTDKRIALLKKAQRFLAREAVHGYLFEFPKLCVHKKELSGFWTSAPVGFEALSELKWVD